MIQLPNICRLVLPLFCGLLLFLPGDPAMGQDRGDRGGRGDRDDRDRWRGRGGDDRGRGRGGDDRRRGDDDRRGRGGDDRRAQWMRSWDRNNDGKLDANEIPEQFRDRFMERAKGIGFDTSRGISVDKYLEKRKQQEGRREQGLPENNPLAFDENLQPMIASGFDEPLSAEEWVLLHPEDRRRVMMDGVEEFSFRVEAAKPKSEEEKKKDEEAARRAKDFMSRLDRDGNGTLEGDEVNGFTQRFDSNKDGKVTQDELATSMSGFGGGRGDRGGRGGWGGRGRGGDDGDRGRGGGDDGGDRGRRGRGGFSGRGGGGFGGPGGGFGGRGPGEFGPPGGPGRDFGNRGGDDDRRDDDKSSEDEKKEDEDGTRKSYRFKSAEDRLPDEAEDWILDKDKNGDGQVSMSEYTSRWSDSKLREFDQIDANGDGVITPKEYLNNKPARTSFRDRRRSRDD